MRDVVIVDSARTGLTKAFRGSFNLTRSDDLLAHCIDTLVDRNDVDPNEVEDVVVGAASHAGEQDGNLARLAVVLSKLPISTGGCDDQPLLLVRSAVHRHCGQPDRLRPDRQSRSPAAWTPSPCAPVQSLASPRTQAPAGGEARDLHGHGQHRRGGGASLSGHPGDAGRVRAAKSAALRRGRGFRRDRRGDRAHEGDDAQGRQGDGRREPRGSAGRQGRV